MHRRTGVLLFAVLAVLIYANVVPKSIPYIEEHEANAYMVKQGWPCSFLEKTNHKRIWEWSDFSVDAAVAIVCLTVLGLASECVIRNELRRDGWRALLPGYVTFVLMLVEGVTLIAVNLAERPWGIEAVRGWPAMGMMVDKDSFFHVLILPFGAAVDAGVALAIVGGTWLLARCTWDAEKKAA